MLRHYTNTHLASSDTMCNYAITGGGREGEKLRQGQEERGDNEDGNSD